MGKEKSLHRNKHDFLLKFKTCQVCGAHCLIIVHREFENLGENNALRKKCWVRETSREAAEGREAGHYRCRRWKVSGIRIPFGSSRGKNSDRGKDGVGLLHACTTPPSCSTWELSNPAGQGLLPPVGRLDSTEARNEVTSSTQVQELTVPKSPLSWDQTPSLPLT